MVLLFSVDVFQLFMLLLYGDETNSELGAFRLAKENVLDISSAKASTRKVNPLKCSVGWFLTLTL